MATYTYIPRKGFTLLTGEEAEIIGRTIEEEAEARGGITAEEVVELARDPASPLHKYFEWDNTKAACEYRKEQARKLMRSYDLVPVESDEESPRIRGVHAVFTDGTQENRRYITVRQLAKNEDYIQQIISSARSQLRGWQSRYEAYLRFAEFKDEFGGIIELIQQLENERS